MGFVAAAGYPSKFMDFRWVTRREKGKSELNLKPPKIPLYISTSPSDVNPQELKQLFISCNHSCHRFPKLDPKEEAVDIDKLCVALSHSCVIVSLFSRPHLDTDTDSASLADKSSKHTKVPLWGNLMQKVMPVTPSNGQLVGFGRAVSDVGLTASIYDVMVSLQSVSIRGYLLSCSTSFINQINYHFHLFNLDS